MIVLPAFLWDCFWNVLSVQKYPVLTEQEKLLLANRERDKGNDAFRANDYEEAVTYYSRSAKFIIGSILLP